MNITYRNRKQGKMSKVKVADFTLEMVQEMCDILNKGNQVEVKRERENIVVVEIGRHALSKNPIK